MAMLAGIQGANGVQESTFGSKFGKLPAGGYVCKILNVKVDKTSKGGLYIKLQIDVSEGEYAGHFQRRFLDDANSQYGQKWKGVYKIFLPTMTGNNDKYMHDIAVYKGQINTITRANGKPELNIEAGYDPDIFKGCTVGVLFRDTEYNGNPYTEAAYLCSPEKIRTGDFEIPEPAKPKQAANNGFTSGGIFATAAQQQQQQQPAAVPNIGDLSDFEEIPMTGDVPF